MHLPNRQTIIEILKTAGIVLGSFLIYHLTANLGLNSATLNKQASPIWPATGVAIGLVFLLGPRAAFGIFLGATLSNFQAGTPILGCLLIAIGNTLEAISGILFFQYLMKSKFEFGTHTISVFAFFSLTFAATISATVGTVALLTNGIIIHEQVFNNWRTWWIGDLLGGLFIIPFAYRAAICKFKQISFNAQKSGKILALLALTVLFNYFVFSSGHGSPYLFLVFLPLLFATIFFESIFIFIISLLTFSWAISATVLGHGPFSGQILNESLIHLQLFLLGLGITSLGLSGLHGPGFNHRIITSLIFGWALSGLTFFSFFNSSQEVDRSHFSSKVDQAQLFLETQLSDYTTLLQSSVGFFNATGHISQSEWSIFSKKLLLNREFEKVEGIGIILPSRTKNISEFYRQNKILKPITGLKIHTPFKIPEGYNVENPEIHLIVSYVEPLALNKLALGMDISVEKSRYQAALEARDTGLPTITDNIALLQNKVAGTAGFILFIPFYRKNSTLSSAAQRKKAFAGLVYSPVVADKFFSNISEKFDQDLNLEVYMSEDLDLNKRVFSSIAAVSNPEAKIIKTTHLLGKKITFVWRKAKSFEHTPGLIFSLMGFFGATITLFLALMLSSLQSITHKAQAIADEKTKEVVEKNIIWKNLTETSPVGIYLTDKDGRCTYVNKTWSELTGLTLEQAQGEGWISSILNDDIDFVMKNWQNLILTGNFSCNYRFYNLKKEIVHISGRAVALRNNSNEVTGYLGITQDVTDSYKKGSALIAASRLSSLGEMASGIAHEINNPLSIILGKSFLLQSLAESENYDDSKVKFFAQQISDTVQRISKIIKGLRAFARETTGEPFERYAVRDVINDTLELCRERFTSHQIELIVQPVIRGSSAI